MTQFVELAQVALAYFIMYSGLSMLVWFTIHVFAEDRMTPGQVFWLVALAPATVAVFVVYGAYRATRASARLAAAGIHDTFGPRRVRPPDPEVETAMRELERELERRP